jgi:hypothetical protein
VDALGRNNDLREGQPVVAWPEGREVRGRVDQAAPHLDLLWIREDGTGSRRLLTASDLAPRERGARHDGGANGYSATNSR